MHSMNFRLRLALVAGLALGSATSAGAQAQQASASGEVRRVDTDAGKIAIRHGAIAELELPAMILVYWVDRALLVGINPGDKIRFTAKRDSGKYVVISIDR